MNRAVHGTCIRITRLSAISTPSQSLYSVHLLHTSLEHTQPDATTNSQKHLHSAYIRQHPLLHTGAKSLSFRQTALWHTGLVRRSDRVLIPNTLSTVHRKLLWGTCCDASHDGLESNRISMLACHVERIL
jgi:hypothetical protein